MRNTVSVSIVAMLAILIGSAPAQAERSVKEEAIGVGSGAVIGAALGGPVGAILGASVGAKLGDTWRVKNESIEQLENSLQASRSDVGSLESNIDTLSNEIERLQNVARPELVSLMQAGIAMDLLFRTDETVLADSTSDRLARLAGTLATMPDIRIKLDGFADERGDEDYNLGLSEKRVNFVREQFVAAGVDPTRIDTSAHGESVAADDSADSYALERRVSVKLFIDDAQSLAANPN
jgi:outer membrane protein OmpA-like peptidoglycan-associated protein